MKWLYLVLGIVSFGLSFFMYKYGGNYSSLSQYMRYFYAPLPIGGYFIYGFIRKMMDKKQK
jgi:hypothetical protein